MARYIDADKLILSLNDFMLVESPTDTENTEERRISEMVCKIIQHCIEVAEEQPTAYDVEKVVEQLEKLKQNLVSNSQMLSARQIEKAIEIVRKGGVE